MFTLKLYSCVVFLPVNDKEICFILICSNDLTSSFSDFGRSSSSFIGLSTLSVDGVNEKRKCVINIYLLTLTSNFLVLTKSAWNNYMIVSVHALNHFYISHDESFDLLYLPEVN